MGEDPSEAEEPRKAGSLPEAPFPYPPLRPLSREVEEEAEAEAEEEGEKNKNLAREYALKAANSDPARMTPPRSSLVRLAKKAPVSG